MLRPWLSCKRFAFPDISYIASASFSPDSILLELKHQCYTTQFPEICSSHQANLIYPHLVKQLCNMAEHVQLSHIHISRFAHSSLVTTWCALLSKLRHVQGYPYDIPFTYIPLPYLPSRHQFTTPTCHVFLITSLLCHYHVCLPWFAHHMTNRYQSRPIPLHSLCPKTS